ncbi:MAG: hypothetical protein Q9168_003544 [Polycauliona sp. 1 TL-2023]
MNLHSPTLSFTNQEIADLIAETQNQLLLFCAKRHTHSTSEPNPSSARHPLNSSDRPITIETIDNIIVAQISTLATLFRLRVDKTIDTVSNDMRVSVELSKQLCKGERHTHRNYDCKYRLLDDLILMGIWNLGELAKAEKAEEAEKAEKAAKTENMSDASHKN